METFTNERLIRRNARIGQIGSIAGLVVLAGGMIISFTRPDLFVFSLGALLVGFILSQIGIYFGNRWSRRPRPDEHLSNALKGLDGRFSLYHYTTPVPHLLVGPAGVWALLPYQIRGRITFQNGRWKQKGGNLYLKIFAQEGLGRPDLEIGNALQSTRNFLEEILTEDSDIPEIQAALVFTNDAAVVEADDAPVTTLHAKKLKDFIRKTAKAKPISMDKVQEIQAAINA